MRLNHLMSPEGDSIGGAAAPGTGSPPAPAAAAPTTPDPKAVAPSDTTLIAGGDAPPDKGADEKPDGKEPITQPEEIEVKLPEGVAEDAEFMGEFKSLAKELGLKSEGAQKLVELQMKAQAKATEANKSQWESTVKTWVDTVKADKDIGGVKLKENMDIAKSAVARFGGKELSDFLVQTGFGNHPAVVKAFVKIGKAIKEDNGAGRLGNGPSGATKGQYETRYPNTQEFKGK